ncbi:MULTISPECIES: oxygen-independent coproporphyrinogen III oxidase [Marichromatium]|uniref:Coproporphyrinogen-III oxidase n=1 Tax=Marichromatium gracile TaxID=1048 RepID=A0A4R4A7Q1_MARGR|nr:MULTISPECIES: oxygen-independent coproporphyrinogen III oxidase [Marichromatium]MBO8086186.1 oxygen-independent coproporphyrinogen III oxidase [Marichromatium sp.]MBK1710345.1 oxygen-independent coproporphyrinogen III oxidase [Marichromatium gracile]RNE89168.1 oxygen-independent coproporphyrinogen III oxidase [Marichromatium sp. AB31]RNE93512.1 oxygen-independent coproporphyrinogen III oxidase [Marichromatium sp. AB32]TCW34509.1 oxygen-independent coproporphyrinogen-3 oxidase [Marichromatiu
MEQGVSFDIELIRRYDQSGPRYTSYPTAVEFDTSFDEAAYRATCARSNESGRPLSIYFHIPFCDTVCFYCACNKVVTKDRSRVAPYLDRVYRELEMQGALFDDSRVVEQLHWGGGTPTFLNDQQMVELMETTRRHFKLADDEVGEYSIEIDPREADANTIALLRRIGFNRMSLGVQDFDERVQKAVNRVQSEAETMAVLEAARAEGFRSISLDLIYGLPFQSVETFMNTLERVIAVNPQRLSIFNYAHLPTRFKPQRRIRDEDLPTAEVKLDILQATIQRLTDAGYVYIGMDHFARPDDELAIAQQAGTLYRNFQGYSTHADCDLIGIGVTSIGKVDNTYGQNQRELDEYYAAIDAGRLPVFRGIELTRDDIIRRDVITRLICNFVLDIPAVEAAWGIDFKTYFADALDKLQVMVEDGLVELDAERIRILPRGRLLVRNICMTFDAYLAAKSGPVGFSKVI